MRRALSRTRGPLLATLAAVLALGVFPGQRDAILDVYVLVLGALALGVIVASIRRANPVATASPFERALRRRAARAERLPDLERLERELGLATQTSADLHFRLRPRLRRIAARLLSARRGIDLDGDPVAARRALGHELWELVREDREPPRRRDEPGPPLPELERMVAAVERL